VWGPRGCCSTETRTEWAAGWSLLLKGGVPPRGLPEGDSGVERNAHQKEEKNTLRGVRESLETPRWGGKSDTPQAGARGARGWDPKPPGGRLSPPRATNAGVELAPGGQREGEVPDAVSKPRSRRMPQTRPNCARICEEERGGEKEVGGAPTLVRRVFGRLCLGPFRPSWGEANGLGVSAPLGPR